MARGLVICAQVPSDNARQAGHKLAYQFIKELSKDHDLDVVLVVNKSDIVPVNLKRDLSAESVEVFRVGRFSKIANILRFFWRIPPRYCTRISFHALAKLKSMIANHAYDFVYYEFTQSAVYHHLIPVERSAVLSCHDIQIQVAFRGNGIDSMFCALTYKFEENLFRKMDEVRVLSEKDLQIAKGLYNVKNVQVVRPPLSSFINQISRKQERIEKYSILFWGAMNRIENEQAVIRFIEEVLPQVGRRFIATKLYVVGSSPSRKLLRYQSGQVVITGYVADPSSYFEKAHIGVVPLLRGAGVKIKTLEMLAAGIPVFATIVGAEGVNQVEDLHIIDFNCLPQAITHYFMGENIS